MIIIYWILELGGPYSSNMEYPPLIKLGKWKSNQKKGVYEVLMENNGKYQ